MVNNTKQKMLEWRAQHFNQKGMTEEQNDKLTGFTSDNNKQGINGNINSSPASQSLTACRHTQRDDDRQQASRASHMDSGKRQASWLGDKLAHRLND